MGCWLCGKERREDERGMLVCRWLLEVGEENRARHPLALVVAETAEREDVGVTKRRERYPRREALSRPMRPLAVPSSPRCNLVPFLCPGPFASLCFFPRGYCILMLEDMAIRRWDLYWRCVSSVIICALDNGHTSHRRRRQITFRTPCSTQGHVIGLYRS